MSATPSFQLGPLETRHEAPCAEALAVSFATSVEAMPAWWEMAGRENLRAVTLGEDWQACLLQIPMGQWFGGRSVPMIGVAGVAVPPENRGTGVATWMMRQFIQEKHREQWPISTLYPSTWSLYRRAGYEIAGSYFRYTLRLRDLPLQPRKPSLRPFQPEDQTGLEAAYRKRAKHRNGFLDRGSYVWQRVREHRGKPRHGFLLDNGKDIQGSIFYYQIQKPDFFWNMELSDFTATSAESACRMLSFLAQHQTMGGEVEFFSGPHEPMLDLLAHRVFESQLFEYWMVRMVHLPKAMESRGWPLGLKTDLQFQIEDDLIGENNGTFRLQISGGEGRWTAGGEGRIQISAPNLAPLYTGFHSATSLAQHGRLQASPEDLALLDAAFAGPPPGMADMF